MTKSAKSAKEVAFSNKWIAFDNKKIIAEGIDLAEVYVNAMTLAKSKPRFKRILA